MMGLTGHYLSNGGATETDQSTGGLLATALFDPSHQKVVTTVQRYVTIAERNSHACRKAFEAAIARRPEPLSQPARHEEEMLEPTIPIETANVAAAGQALYREEETELPGCPAPAVPPFPDRC